MEGRRFVVTLAIVGLVSQAACPSDSSPAHEDGAAAAANDVAAGPDAERPQADAGSPITADGAAEDTAGEADVPEDACLVLPEATGEAVTFTKTPYLQAPVSDGMTVAFETDVAVPGQVAVWRAGEPCLDALVATRPVRMDTYLAVLDVVMEEPEGHQHFGKVTGLEPGAYYRYQVVVGQAVSDEGSFRTAPPRGAPFSLVIYGDTRTHDEPHQAVVDRALLHQPDLLVTTGDAMTTAGVLWDWETLFAIEGEILRDRPVMPSFGNHEAILGHAYWAGYYEFPGAFDATELDYAFAYGDTYWIVFDSNGDVEGERLAWIEARLVEGEAWPYLFVSFHHPFYTFAKHVPDLAMRELLHPKFVQHGVGAVWSGHNHCYERFMVDGIAYVVAGGGGASLYSVDSDVVPDEEALRVAARSAHSYVAGEITPDKATFTVYDVDLDGEIFDAFEVLPRASE